MMVAGAVGTGVSALGAIQQGKAAKATAEYQAQIARNNEIIAQQNADYALKAGQQKAALESMKSARRVGAVRAAIAASGVDAGSGSSLDVIESEREKGKLDTETVMHNAELEAYGYRTKATNFRADAALKEAEGDMAESAGFTKGLGTVLSGASAFGSQWSRANPPKKT